MNQFEQVVDYLIKVFKSLDKKYKAIVVACVTGSIVIPSYFLLYMGVQVGKHIRPAQKPEVVVQKVTETVTAKPTKDKKPSESQKPKEEPEPTPSKTPTPTPTPVPTPTPPPPEPAPMPQPTVAQEEQLISLFDYPHHFASSFAGSMQLSCPGHDVWFKPNGQLVGAIANGNEEHLQYCIRAVSVVDHVVDLAGVELDIKDPDGTVVGGLSLTRGQRKASRDGNPPRPNEVMGYKDGFTYSPERGFYRR